MASAPFCTFILCCLGPTARAAVTPVTTILSVTGDRVSRGTGVLSDFKPPVLGDSGAAAFVGTLRDSGFLSGGGIFLATAASRTAQTLVLSGDPAPDQNGNVATINNPLLYISGQNQAVVQLSFVQTLGGSLDTMGIFRSDGALLARSGGSAPGGFSFDTFTPEHKAVNATGDVAFTAYLRGTPGGFSDNFGLYRANSSGVVEIARVGNQVPGDNAAFISIGSPVAGPAINDVGQVAFTAVTRPPIGALNSGLFLGDGGTLTPLVREGEPAPSQNGLYTSFQLVRPTLNNRGEAAFIATFRNSTQATADNTAVVRVSAGGKTELARKGAFTPGNRGRFLDFVPDVALNNSGTVLFLASITGATDGSNAGVFLADETSVTAIARVTDAAPGGGKFAQFSTTSFALNDAGQAVFYATLTPDSAFGSATFGLFFYDPAQGLFAVARQNTSLADLGSISSIEFSPGFGADGPAHSGLNNKGEVAFKSFVGNQAVIALWGLRDIGNNQPPTATPLARVTGQGQNLQLTTADLLSVIADPEGGSITLNSVASKSTNGASIFRSGTNITYTPVFSFQGADEFTYVASDNVGLTVEGKVQITVTAPNHSPVFVRGGSRFTQTVQPGTQITFSTADLLAVATDPDNDPLSVDTLPATTSRGAPITRTADQVTLAPLLDLGSDSFTYAIVDGRGGSLSVTAEFLAAGGLSTPHLNATDVTFSLTAAAGTWTIERTDNLPGPWTKLGDLTISAPSRTAGNGSAEFHDTSARSAHAFYRAWTPSSGGGTK